MSSLRVILPSGAVVSVLRVTPIVEQVISFNGQKHRLIGVARDMKNEANGVLINVMGLKRHERGQGDIFSSFNSPDGRMNREWVEEDWDDVVVGNLKNEQVQEIIRDICEKGYYDFSRFEYQIAESSVDLKLGNAYLPYHNEDQTNLCIFSNRNDHNGYDKFRYEDITFLGGDILGSGTPIMEDGGERNSGEE